MIRQNLRLDRIDGRDIDAEQDNVQFAQPGDRLRFQHRNPVRKSRRIRKTIRFQQDPARFADLRTRMFQINNADGRLSPGKPFRKIDHDRRSDVICEWNGVDGGTFSVEMKWRVRVRSVVRAHAQCSDIDRTGLAETPSWLIPKWRIPRPGGEIFRQRPRNVPDLFHPAWRNSITIASAAFALASPRPSFWATFAKSASMRPRSVLSASKRATAAAIARGSALCGINSGTISRLAST